MTTLPPRRALLAITVTGALAATATTCGATNTAAGTGAAPRTAPP
jgi:hypothetical protein